MNRREFIVKSSAAITIGLLQSKSLPVNAMAFSITNETNLVKSFSMDIVTDNPKLAIDAASGIISKFGINGIKFSEERLAGEFTGDIAAIINEKLLDINDRDINPDFINLRKQLGMPRKLTNPYLIIFSGGSQISGDCNVIIYERNTVIDRFKLKDTSRELSIKGKKGELITRIDNGKIAAIHSDCRHKTCVKMGSISKAGQNIICIPNGIRIAIEGRINGKIDAVSY